MWLYSNMDVKRILVQDHPRAQPLHYPEATDADICAITEDSKIQMMSCLGAEMNYFRGRFLAKRINFQFFKGGKNYLFFADGKLFGFAVVMTNKFGKHDRSLVLACDFVVPVPTQRRLAKLVLLLLQTDRIKEDVEDWALRPVPGLKTIVITDNPVSMKYRDVFDLAGRGESEGRSILILQDSARKDDLEGSVTGFGC